ncbi:hypothetical protein [Dactylosporangium salmoneum]|uniref:Uncharacterized protein n=1 Tax=Dactylosporangium salmoneum TaxID=53361 RepID=A0ABP5SJS6_9ACTN
MTDPEPHPDIPTRAERQASNAALHTDHVETGFWEDDGRPAAWPDDIEDWTPGTYSPRTRDPGQPPF